MNFQYLSYNWLLLVSAGIILALAAYVWRNRDVRGAAVFVVAMLLAAFWCGANALEMAGTDLPTKLFWANVQYLAYALHPVVWLVFALYFTGRESWLTRRRLALLLLIPALTQLLIWTNDMHGLMRYNVFLDTNGPFPVIGKTYGPWFWVHITYSYGLILGTLIMLAYSLRHKSLLYREQSRILFLSLLASFTTSAVYVLGLSPLPRHDLTPVVFSGSCLIISWGLFRYRLFDVTPVARDILIESMADVVVVLDPAGRVVDANPAAREFLGLSGARVAGEKAEDVFARWPFLAGLVYEGETAASSEFVAEQAGGSCCYEVSSLPLYTSRGRLGGRLLVLRDITERQATQERLLRQQRAMAGLEEREKLARELHDNLAQVLGYLNVQAQAILEQLGHGQTTLAEDGLERLARVAQEAHGDVREYILGMRDRGVPEQSFLPALRNYLQRFEGSYGIEAELRVAAGQVVEAIDPAAGVQLLRIIQEALSNVRKHAGASRVWISLEEIEDQLLVAVEDNGRGFALAADGRGAGQGFGLGIMNERAAEIGGHLRIDSRPDRGTTVTVNIPVKKGSSTSHENSPGR